jgi:hypothetical protein
MRASEERITAVREDAANAVAARTHPIVERYEVVVQAS